MIWLLRVSSSIPPNLLLQTIYLLTLEIWQGFHGFLYIFLLLLLSDLCPETTFRDSQILENDVDILFAPTPQVMYPPGMLDVQCLNPQKNQEVA
jgi:hypothetical protein